MGLFKKRAPEIQTIEVEKIVEKEVPVKSRLTFAHNDNIGVVKHFFKFNQESNAYELTAHETFTFWPFKEKNGDNTIYPVFMMPSEVATTRLTSPSRIVCIGCIIVNENNEIIDVNALYNGRNMVDVLKVHDRSARDLFSGDDLKVTIMNDTVIDIEPVMGEIDYQTFARSISISHALPWMLK